MKVTAILAGTLLAATTVAFAADTDFARLRKDVSVMEKILLTDFEDGRGSVTVDGSYLARQGAVFRVNPARAMRFAWDDSDDVKTFMITRDGDGEIDRDFEFSFIGDIGAIVDEALGAVPLPPPAPSIDTELRGMIRELTRETRELEREMARLRVEMIHVDDDEKPSIEEEIASIEQEMDNIESKRASMTREIEAEVEAFETKRREAIEEREARRREQLARIEETLLTALCDYGSTLQNLPNNEHVSLVVENANDDESRVFVFDKRDITSCQGGADALRKSALEYLF